MVIDGDHITIVGVLAIIEKKCKSRRWEHKELN